ncbi:MAG: hypothetical protein Q9P14_07790 [candidate division KSB1 bacterium]|nr:hypothetical protein [candidate division KSB1 bacterium]
MESPHAARSLKQRQIQQMHLRRAFFPDIAANLSREERWWFYIVSFEALKHPGSPLPKGGLAEYLKLLPEGGFCAGATGIICQS